MDKQIKWLKIAAAVIVAGILVTIVLVLIKPDSPNSQNTNSNVPLLGDKHADLGQKHINDGEAHEPYNSTIPSSGPHYIKPANWGISDSQIADETLIHNMEHGGVVITYKPSLSASDVNKLKEIFSQLPKSSKFNEVKAVLVPRSGNDHLVQLGAWTYTLNLDSIDANTIKQFYNGHLDKGPELVP